MGESYLQTLIKAVRSELENTSPQLPTAISAFKKAITDTLKELSKGNNLRIYDDTNGGVVRGPKNSRSTKEDSTTGNLLCQKQYLTDNKLEVPYFRSVFNLPAHTFALNTTPDLTVRLIGYESPLMRKKTDRMNGEISSRAISCDLVGLASDNRILCIEGKVNPHNQATDIVYGLLEGFAYGVCVEYFLSEKERRASFCKEAGGCLSEFHPNAHGFNEGELTAAFTLAAPREYFAQYFNPTQTGTERAHRNLKEKIETRLTGAEQLLAAFEMSEGPAWAGFLIMEPPCTISSFDARNGRTIAGKKYCEPHFKPESSRVGLAANIAALKQAVESRGVTR